MKTELHRQGIVLSQASRLVPVAALSPVTKERRAQAEILRSPNPRRTPIQGAGTSRRCATSVPMVQATDQDQLEKSAYSARGPSVISITRLIGSRTSHCWTARINVAGAADELASAGGGAVADGVTVLINGLDGIAVLTRTLGLAKPAPQRQ